MAYLRSRIAAVFIGLVFAFSYSSSQADEGFNAQEIEQMVAPVALYPDALLSQVLMAATYPIDVVQAARWRAHQSRSLTDQQLSALIENQPWDPSVKSVAAFPDVLAMMNDQIDWTGRLGDAFLYQQNEVMGAVQRLRLRAQQAGHLASGPQQRVVMSGAPSVIVIEPARPEVVYVPIYNPLLVYGAWPYPDYRPYYWHPPSYVANGGVFGFSAGLIVGRALWSNYDWRRNSVIINVNRYNSFNRTHITSAEWRRNARYRSDAYRRSHARSGNDPFHGQRRPGFDRNNDHRRHDFQGRPGSAAAPDRVRVPGRAGAPDRVHHSGRVGTPDRVRNAGVSDRAAHTPSRVRPDAGPKARGPVELRSRPQQQPATGSRVDRVRNESGRGQTARPGIERQARPQAQRPERAQRSAASRGRSDEGQGSRR